MAGDFNGDGELDFVVAMVETKAARKFTMLVFNGPLRPNEAPSFINTDLSMSGIGFFFGPPRPKPYRLVVGAFESEGYILIPKGQTYQFGKRMRLRLAPRSQQTRTLCGRPHAECMVRRRFASEM